MKIAFDAQLLFEKEKTGIGWTAENIIKYMVLNSNNDYILNYFSARKSKDKRQITESYAKLGYNIKKCGWFHNVIYRRIWNNIALPYSLFFGKQAEITQFFNYDIPPGVHGKAVTFIYDMVYKVYPDTVSKKTMDMLNYNINVTCKRADHIITISEFSKSEIIKYLDIPSDKISVMPCGVDLNIYRPDYTSKEVEFTIEKYNINDEYILYLGTLEPRKNIERLIEAYNLLKKSYARKVPKLVIAGKKGWMYDKIFHLVEELQLKSDVIFTGYVNSEDIPMLFQGAKLFVFPSIYEGFGMPPLEAMACGTPVMVSNQASIPEVVGEAGYYINPYNVNDICDAMKTLIESNELRMRLREKGLLRAKNFTWNSSVIRLMDIYNKIL